MPALDDWLDRFPLDLSLRDEVAHVLGALPGAVLEDFLCDPSFSMSDYEPAPFGTYSVVMAAPGAKSPSRSVVLKRTLRRRPVEFVRWVIAHYLAHAHLRNRGRWPGDDPEVAADSLAAAWGFPKPPPTGRNT